MAARGKSKKRVAGESDSEFVPDNHTEEPPTKKQNLGQAAPPANYGSQQSKLQIKKGPMPKPTEPPKVVADLLIEPDTIELTGHVGPCDFQPPCDEFPRWKDGDVYIELEQGHPKYTYQLHSAMLTRASSWFAREISDSPSFLEPSQSLAAKLTREINIAFRFELVYDSNLGSKRLVKKPLTIHKEVEQLVPGQSSKSIMLNNPASLSTNAVSQKQLLSTRRQNQKNKHTNQNGNVKSYQFDGPNDFDADGADVQNMAETLANLTPKELKTDKLDTSNEQNHITRNSIEGFSIKEEEELKDHVVANLPAFEPNYTTQEELQEHAIKMENDDNPMSRILDELIAGFDRSRSSSSLSTLTSLEEFDEVSDTLAQDCCFQEPIMKTEEIEAFTSSEKNGDVTGMIGKLATRDQDGASNSIAKGQNLSFVEGSQDQLKVEHYGNISSSAPIEQNPVLVEGTQDKPMRPEHRVEANNLIGQNLVLAENHQDQLMAGYHEEIILPADTFDREVLPAPSPGPIEGNYIANPATDEQVLRPTDAPRALSAQKEEDMTEASSSGEVILAKIPPELLEAYNNLFLMWDSKPPNIDIKNIGTALKQTETLVVVAQLYESESPSFFRMCLNNSILQFGRDVYQAILEEPHRWLQLSLQLESKPIFQEAIIHLVGCWPSYWATAQESDLPEYVFDLCQQKLTELKSKKKDIDEKLFCQTITLHNPDSKLIVDFSDKATFDTYFVVNGWREWFVSKISEAKRNRIKDCVDAKAYRTMAKGGETYLPLSSMIKALEHYRQDEHRNMLEKQITSESIKEDLKLLKDYAQKTVEPLCKNYSLLSIEEFGITHFTCTKVENNELPWLLNAESQGGNEDEKW